jgi:transcription elongation factor Elf1
MGGHAVLQQMETTLPCQSCGHDTVQQVLYLGQRIAEVRCGECGRCVGMDRDDVVRSFIGEIVIHVLRLAHDVTAGLKRDPGRAVVALPRKMARLPVALAHDAVRLLRMVRSLRENGEVAGDLFAQAGSTLTCQTCGRETPHRILYLGRRIAEARCEECGGGIGLTREEVFSDFVGEAFLHLLRMPRHVRRELRSDFTHAVQTLPRQMVRMPFHLARDFVRLVRILRSGESHGKGSRT